MPLRSPGSPSRRAGFTTVELMIVVALVGVLTVIATPRFAAWRERGSVQAARQQIATAVATARAAAVQRGSSSAFMISEGVIKAWALSPEGDTVWVIRPADLDSILGVTTTLGSAADSMISFDGRGLSRRASGGDYRYVIEQGDQRDSVCVGSGGMVLPRRCTP